MKCKIKILYILHSPFFNGAEICIYKLIKNINKDIFEPIVVLPENGPMVYELNKLGIKTQILSIERWIRFENDKKISNSDMFSRSKKIMDIIEEENIDIVHTNTSVVLEGAIAAKLKNIPHIWHIHEYLQGHKDLKPVIPLPIVYFLINSLSDKIITVSDYAKRQFESIDNQEKFEVIHNGVEENDKKKNESIFYDYVNKNNNELIAVILGLLNESKGFENLIKTVSIVRRKGYKINFFWIGGALKKSLKIFKSKIKKSGLKDMIYYIGFRTDIQEIIKSSDLLISFSLNEALPTVILEAMAAGKAVIATNCGGTSECVENGVTGYLVPVNNPEKMSEKIVELASDSSKRIIFGENGFNKFKKSFSINMYVKKFENVYSNLINSINKKDISKEEEILIKSFLKMYDQASNCMWRKSKIF